MTDLVTSYSELIPLDILALEKELLALPQKECEVFHHFSPGIYTRGVRLPAGIFAIGHYQKNAHLNVMIRGKVIMVHADGTTSIVEAPQIFVGEPGKKMGYVLEDVLWLNVYPTNETDIEKLEAMFVEKSAEFVQEKADSAAINAAFYDACRADFDLVLSEFGFTHKEATEQSENGSDQIGMPTGTKPIFSLRSSPIAGTGVFLSAGVPKGQIIGVARVGEKRTPLGRYTNHSIKPNAEFIKIEGDIYLISKDDIQGCLGGSPGTEITVDYRQALTLAGVIKKGPP